MSANFNIIVKKYKDDLHINPSGDFDGSSAWELVNVLKEKFDGNGQVIIDTSKLFDVCPFGSSTFQYQLKLSRVPADRLFFKGERGREIAPKGSKVIVDTKMSNCRCSGDCAICACKENKQN